MQEYKRSSRVWGLSVVISGTVFWGMVLTGLLAVAFISHIQFNNFVNTTDLQARLIASELEKNFSLDMDHNQFLQQQEISHWARSAVNNSNFTALELNTENIQLKTFNAEENANVISIPLQTHTGNVDLKLYSINLDEKLNAIRKELLISIGLVIVAFGAILQLVLQYIISKPVLEMVNVAKQFKDGDESVRFNESRQDELGYMAKFINSALDSVLSERVATQRTLHQLEINQQALKQQHDLLEERVLERTEELRLANKDLESYSYSIAHDLRQPLRGLDGFSLILLEDYSEQLDEEAVNYLNRIRSSAQRMGELIDDLLNLSKIGRIELNVIDVDLSFIANDITNQLKHQPGGEKYSIDIEQGLRCQSDPNLLRIILENLLGNAWKYCAESDSPAIEFKCEKQDGDVVYMVKDNGIGFDEKFKDKLFKPFSRLHNDSRFDGTGIGLASVYRAIKRSGGKIWATSQPDQGATFYFKLGKTLAEEIK